MTRAMGFDPEQMGTLQYAREQGWGITALNDIEVRGAELGRVLQPFTPHEQTDLQLRWQVENAAELLVA